MILVTGTPQCQRPICVAASGPPATEIFTAHRTPAPVDDMVVLYRIFRLGYGAAVSPAVQEITGRPPRSFRDFVHDHADRFRQAR